MGWKDAVARDLLGPKEDLRTLPGYWIRPKKYSATVGAELQALEMKMANRSPTFAKLMSKAIEDKGEEAIPKDVFDSCDVETRGRISLEMAEAAQEYGPRQTHLMLVGGIGDHNFANDDNGKASIDEEFVEVVRSNRAVLDELLAIVRSWNPPFSRSGPARSGTPPSGSIAE